MRMMYGLTDHQVFLCDALDKIISACMLINTLCLDSTIGIETADRANFALRKCIAEIAYELDSVV